MYCIDESFIQNRHQKLNCQWFEHVPVFHFLRSQNSVHFPCTMCQQLVSGNTLLRNWKLSTITEQQG